MAPGFHTVWLSGSSWAARDFKAAAGSSERYEDEEVSLLGAPRHTHTRNRVVLKVFSTRTQEAVMALVSPPCSSRLEVQWPRDGRTPDLCAGAIPPWSGSGWCRMW